MYIIHPKVFFCRTAAARFFSVDIVLNLQSMTAIHVLLLQGKKNAVDTLKTLKFLLEHGLRDLINQPDSLGNTPLHALIIRSVLFKEGKLC